GTNAFAGHPRLLDSFVEKSLSAAGQRGLVHAAWIFGQIIARERIGARARSAADFLVFACTALAFARAGIAQETEQAGIAIHLDQRIPQHVTGRDREKAAGVDFAGVRDEDEAFAVAHAGGAPDHAARGCGLGRRTVLGLLP